MREDLIKVLNYKLKSVTNNVEALNQVNGKIDDETVHLKYIQDAIENFKGEESCFDIYKFVNVDRETFNRLLMELDDSVLKTFGTNSCNYDGLIYLINGINNGISLSLTQEQVMAINLFIDKLLEKEKVYQDIIVDLNGEKQELEITDLDVLKELQNKYSLIIEEVEEQKYVLDVNAIIEAIIYSDLSKEKTFEMLCFLLEYNAKIYEEEQQAVNKKIVVAPVVPETQEKESVEETTQIKNPQEEVHEELPVVNATDAIDLTIPFEVTEHSVEIPIETSSEVTEHFVQELSSGEEEFDKTIKLPEFDYVTNKIVEEKIPQPEIAQEPVQVMTPQEEVNVDVEDEVSSPSITVDSEPDISEEVKEETKEDVDVDFNDLSDEDFDDYNPILPSLETGFVNLDNKKSDFSQEEVALPVEEPVQMMTPQEEVSVEVQEEIPKTAQEPVPAEPIVNAPLEPEQPLPVIETPLVNPSSKLDEAEVKALFNEYGYKYEEIDEVTRELILNGNIETYRDIFAKLKELNVLGLFEKNQYTLLQILLYSSSKVIDEIVKIIGESLSVDEDDKKITTNIIFKTMPSIFVKNDNGNYQNFMDNIKSFKEYGIDLINLFDFSREVYVANHEFIVNNYNIVRSYDLTVNDNNAKYLLLLPNISQRIDYYVESLYKDNLKGGTGDMFDGLDIIKLYPKKLNIVEPETIKRLRYSSENGLKIFGSKEKSLTGEITNLKVDVINMPDDYVRTFFNNEFDIIGRDDVDKYERLVNTNEFVELKLDDLLNKLEGYRQGVRYVIEGINISRNKVIRNYNILVNNGVEKNQALLFAICYNLMVTKDEYAKLKNIVQSLGGN